jgi:hypothetical protein
VKGFILVPMNASRAVSRRHLAASPFGVPEVTVAPTAGYQTGDLVTHDRYGLGTVSGVEEGAALHVDFGPHRQRVAMPCAKLTKL